MHFHLHDDVVISNKKVKNVQFYISVLNESENLMDQRGIIGEEDEEEREEKMIQQMNLAFRGFMEKATKIANEWYDEAGSEMANPKYNRGNPQ